MLNLTDSGFDDIPCLTQYDLMINGTSVGSVDSECCVGDSCTCQMTVTTGLNITSEDSEFTVSLVSNAHFETEDCPPIRKMLIYNYVGCFSSLFSQYVIIMQLHELFL